MIIIIKQKKGVEKEKEKEKKKIYTYILMKKDIVADKKIQCAE